MTHEPYIEEDLRDFNWVEAHMASIGHLHIYILIADLEDMTRQHLLLHRIGLEGTPAHTEVVEKAVEIAQTKARAWAGLWN